MATILEQIVQQKRQDLAALKARYPKAESSPLPPSSRSLAASLQQGSGFILECKKASPSKGLIRADFDPLTLAQTYAPYASAISVLTDEPYFQGHPDYLAAVAQQVDKPVLMKDFFIDPMQVRLARYLGADAILLMLSILDDHQYQQLAALAGELGLDVLTEVANEQERDRAVALGAAIIGINNRNLHDMSIDLARTLSLAATIPADRIIVSESGIRRHDDVRHLRGIAQGFLVGSELMAQADVDLACRRLIYGEHKVCGLTRPADARAAYNAGACYGGLIFAASPRQVTLAEAAVIKAAAPLAYVGVFANSSVDTVATVAKQLQLHAIQLHGDEDQQFITALRQHLALPIWKAASIDNPDPAGADRLVLDSRHAGQFGGTGRTFDWQQFKGAEVPVMLAGGIGPDNVQAALGIPGIRGLDLNSQLESAPGIKDPALIRLTFERMKLA
ncbi:bifunctional indole-3-glycerol-phosphate synthase TrpC/phosphoribosylanthranilate isomerase TrpF [Gallaecimonas sp. GXIMD1310]|uniref:bifunctional indole-3-glycerol-phosphate synthase TrpC/phosphoribosylanthranilate isomerase TrpF n=1 Tax=Gallaecimonas sp. GXIMD1310 TaxID=3131926 RepID=UPI003248BDE9